MRIQPAGHKILVKPKPIEEKSKGGIILARDTERYQEATTEGTVVALGPTAYLKVDNGTPWDINLYNLAYDGQFSEIAQLPQVVDVSLSFKPIMDTLQNRYGTMIVNNPKDITPTKNEPNLQTGLSYTDLSNEIKNLNQGKFQFSTAQLSRFPVNRPSRVRGVVEAQQGYSAISEAEFNRNRS